MREVVFNRYWWYACIPGIWGELEEAELDNKANTLVYWVYVVQVNFLVDF